MPPIDIILNTGSGSYFAERTESEIREAFSDIGVEVVIHPVDDGEDVGDLAHRLAQGEGDIVIAAGGDGTISAVAGAVIEHGKTLGVLPLGTLNHFARDLGIPQDLSLAVKLIKIGAKRKVDAAQVNGHYFVNNSSIGLYPRIVRKRDSQQERLGRGKWYAALVAAIKTFRRDPYYVVRFELEGNVFTRKTPFVFVGNNRYGMDLYNIVQRESLNEGKICVYLVRRNGRWGVLLILLKTIFGMLRQTKEFEAISTNRVSIAMKKKRANVALDGEIRSLELPLDYRIVPNALTVIANDDEEAA